MPRLSRSNVVVAVLVVGAIALGALGFAGFGEEVANSLLFAALAMVLLALFMLAPPCAAAARAFPPGYRPRS